MTKTRTRRILLFIVIAFAIFSIYTNPVKSAGYVRDGGSLVASAVTSVGQFFGSIAS